MENNSSKQNKIDAAYEILIADGIKCGLSATQIASGLKRRVAAGTPTYRAYDDPAEQWSEWKRQAFVLPLSEIRRHASVSTGNRHSCRDCFCCACVEAVKDLTA